MGNDKVFLAEMEALRDSRNFTIRKKLYRLSPDISNSLHWHDFCEIEVIVGGKGEHLVNGKSFALHRGSAYLLTPKDFHGVREDPDDPLQLYNINFNDQILPESLCADLNNLDDLFCVTFPEEEIGKIEVMMEDLVREYDENEPHRDEMILSLFEMLVIRIIRQHQKSKHATENDPAQKPNLPVNQVITYLKKNFREPITLNRCAKMVYLTPNYLGELFRKTVQMSFSDYLKHLRFDNAVNLLNSTSESMEQISKLSGFHSSAYFIVLFRKHFGITPAQYRKLSEEERVALMREKQQQLNHLRTHSDI